MAIERDFLNDFCVKRKPRFGGAGWRLGTKWSSIMLDVQKRWRLHRRLCSFARRGRVKSVERIEGAVRSSILPVYNFAALARSGSDSEFPDYAATDFSRREASLQAAKFVIALYNGQPGDAVLQ